SCHVACSFLMQAIASGLTGKRRRVAHHHRRCGVNAGDRAGARAARPVSGVDAVFIKKSRPRWSGRVPLWKSRLSWMILYECDQGVSKFVKWVCATVIIQPIQYGRAIQTIERV